MDNNATSSPQQVVPASIPKVPTGPSEEESPLANIARQTSGIKLTLTSEGRIRVQRQSTLGLGELLINVDS
jgi:hypothetical protein